MAQKGEKSIMAGIIQYVTYQDNRKEVGTHLYYGRAVHTTTIGTEQLADRIQHSCTLKVSDIIACLKELSEVIRDELGNSNRVRIDGLGTFYVNVKSKGAESEEEFTATENITGFRVKFLPEGKKDGTTGKITRNWLEDLKVQKATGFIKA